MSDAKELGKIDGAWIGYEDHGILTCAVSFDFGGKGQSFGTYRLDEWNKTEDRGIGTAAGMDMIIQIIRAVGVERWEELKGQECWVERKDGRIVAFEAPDYRKHYGKFDVEKWSDMWFPK